MRQLARGGAHQLPRTLGGGRRELEEPHALALDMLAQALKVVAALFEQVALVGGDYLRARGQLGIVLRQLRVDGLEILHRVAALAARDVRGG